MKDFTENIKNCLTKVDILFDSLDIERMPCLCRSNRNSYSHYIFIYKKYGEIEYTIRISDHDNPNKGYNHLFTILTNDGNFSLSKEQILILKTKLKRHE